jgi:hypothetical protein
MINSRAIPRVEGGRGGGEGTLTWPRANIINYELFAVNHDAQLSRNKIFTIYWIIHRYIYFLCYEITKIMYVKE